jgi:hypothetical protein
MLITQASKRLKTREIHICFDGEKRSSFPKPIFASLNLITIITDLLSHPISLTLYSPNIMILHHTITPHSLTLVITVTRYIYQPTLSPFHTNKHTHTQTHTHTFHSPPPATPTQPLPFTHPYVQSPPHSRYCHGPRLERQRETP